VYIQSRDLRPLDRYFPELHDALLERLPDGCVVDGEIVIATPAGLDFDALQLRLHPAASRVAKLAALRSPSSSSHSTRLPSAARTCAGSPWWSDGHGWSGCSRGPASVYLTPMTRDRALAAEWLEQFEGAGLDGVIVKPATAPYDPGKRTMFKVKHARTADCVVAGFRWHKSGRASSWARCCSASMTTRIGCSTWASRRRSRWRATGAGSRAGAAAEGRAEGSSLA
jgi:hypothetical protein